MARLKWVQIQLFFKSCLMDPHLDHFQKLTVIFLSKDTSLVKFHEDLIIIVFIYSYYEINKYVKNKK